MRLREGVAEIEAIPEEGDDCVDMPPVVQEVAQKGDVDFFTDEPTVEALDCGGFGAFAELGEGFFEFGRVMVSSVFDLIIPY